MLLRIIESYCYQKGYPIPVEEHKGWHPTRKWRFDIAWPDLKIAIEKEGGIYGKGDECPMCGKKGGGAHSSVTGMLRDIEKYNEAGLLGWMVLRVTPEDVKNGLIYNLIDRAMLNVFISNGEPK